MRRVRGEVGRRGEFPEEEAEVGEGGLGLNKDFSHSVSNGQRFEGVRIVLETIHSDFRVV